MTHSAPLPLTTVVIALTGERIPTDVLELLIHGSAAKGIRPGALQRALSFLPLPEPPKTSATDDWPEFRFFSGPWENSRLPTIVRRDPEGGDPHILATLQRVHSPDALYELCALANAALPLPDHSGRPGREAVARTLYGYNAYVERLWIPDPSAPYEGAVKWNDDAALAIADAILALPFPDHSGQWRGIESAPKDGTWIIGFWPASDIVQPLYCSPSGRWQDASDAEWLSPPTHWTPLPSPPRDEPGEGGEP